MSVKSFKLELREDANCQRFGAVYRTAQAAINVERLETEIRYLHANRSARTLNAAKISPKILSIATIEDLSARSRLTEIKLLAYRTEELLSIALSKVRSYVKTQYRDDIAELSGSTKADREATLDVIFEAPVAFLGDLKSLSTQIDMIIKDIDQGSFNLRRLQDMLAIQLDRREHTL
jgi:hypothetical protein